MGEAKRRLVAAHLEAGPYAALAVVLAKAIAPYAWDPDYWSQRKRLRRQQLVCQSIAIKEATRALEALDRLGKLNK